MLFISVHFDTLFAKIHWHTISRDTVARRSGFKNDTEVYGLDHTPIALYTQYCIFKQAEV